MKSDYPFKIKNWGRYEYLPVLKAMQHFTETRQETTPDEVWLVEHPPVYTLGPRGTQEDLVQSTAIPIINTDRGGKITYHGPGQLVIYPLLDVKRLGYHLRQLVNTIEETVIKLLADYKVMAYAEKTAPGVYIEGAKVASLGLRIRPQGCYHGLSINVDMDLSPFQIIYPCGLKNIQMTNMVDWVGPISLATVGDHFLFYFAQSLGYVEGGDCSH